ncbi:MAG: glycosyltransferase family 4 protein [Prolixibacteraceae bacterium]|jgi:glycosyltransferase involved in cell wall biosynthesis|nr:glycosyltransferase family 4 protein [Prolixibacteraceae bacterium]
MKLAFISTYSPRKCGLATFCENMIHHLLPNLQDEDTIEVFAISNSILPTVYKYPVKHMIRQNKKIDYENAAKLLNSEFDICIVQFEHGIFGGNEGLFIVHLLAQLQIKVITILHTVLKSPTFNQYLVVKQVANYSSRIVVMAGTAIDFLQCFYFVDVNKVVQIEHGLPDYQNALHRFKKSDFGWGNKHIITTFGLISSGKGYEYVLKALPSVIAKFPDTQFIIIGQTHPNVIEQEGESYRNYLIEIIEDLGLEKHVQFINRHVREEELMDYLSVADLYVCPYLDEKQITSGTLSYALGSGAAVLATPFWHSKELFEKGYILNFPFRDVEYLSLQIIQLFSDKTLLTRYQQRARNYGYELSWPKIAKKYIALFQEINKNKCKSKEEHFPEIDLKYLQFLSDENGIFQHANDKGILIEHGYCLDDNARSLIAMINYYDHSPSEEVLQLINIYFSFIEKAQTPQGLFLNFASFPKLEFSLQETEDAIGRAIWALGSLLTHKNLKSFHSRAQKLIDRIAPHIAKFQGPRGVANALIGFALLGRVEIVQQQSDKLLNWYKQTSKSDWHWFESYLTYDNGILPLSLLYAYDVSKVTQYQTIAIESLQFLNDIHFQEDYLSVIGNDGWKMKNEVQSKFSQQPIDAMASVLVNVKAFEITGDITYKRFALKSMDWFYGNNILHAPLYDPFNCSCHDGLDPLGVNENQGAESTLAYIISRIEIEKFIV